MDNITVDNAILYYSIADNYSLTAQKEMIYKFIVCNFMDIARTPQFTLMPVERLIGFLRDDNLNVYSELDVFFMVVCWIDCDRAERMKVAATLLTEAVRMQLISPENLVTDVEPVQWLFENKDCQEIYIKALKYVCYFILNKVGLKESKIT